MVVSAWGLEQTSLMKLKSWPNAAMLSKNYYVIFHPIL